jgi:ATP-dependent RNA helicase DeaD
MKFKDLGINENIQKVVNEKKFNEPTEIQKLSIPIILQGRDIIAGSKTGSGKTFAFAIPIIQNSVKGQGIQAIVLTPTRELARQVRNEINDFSKHKNLTVTEIYGGVSINPQIEKLKYTDVVVGTPGRVLDHLGRRTMKLNKVKTAVLDEADRMLDMGFIEDVNKILNYCPRKKQTLLFSATISTGLYKLAKNHMDNPEKIVVDEYVDPSNLKQIYYNIKGNEKLSLLTHLLEKKREGLVMIFCNTQRTVNFVARNLQKQGFEARAIHGGFSQAKRTRTMKNFNQGKAHILVCTDVAARGLHIENVSHVYNYDIPRNSKQYIHRIGRTARVGEKGIAVNLLAPKDHENMDRVYRDNDVNIKKKETPDYRDVRVIVSSRNKRIGHRRRRRY